MQLQNYEIPMKPGLANCAGATRESKLNFLLAWLDLGAIALALVATGILGLTALVFSVVQLERLISSLWASPVERWLIIALCGSILWVSIRWRLSLVE